jgi:hypothetical protein
VGVPALVVFLNKVDMVDDPELLELVEMEGKSCKKNSWAAHSPRWGVAMILKCLFYTSERMVHSMRKNIHKSTILSNSYSPLPLLLILNLDYSAAMKRIMRFVWTSDCSIVPLCSV